MAKIRTRSTSGCLTCRKRKKKCDESSYPSCGNCLHSGLSCNWPDHVKKVKSKPASSPESLDLHPAAHSPAEPVDVNSSYSLINFEPLRYGMAPDNAVYGPPSVLTENEYRQQFPYPIDRGARVSKPEKKGKRYFLERISMQQDCVDDDELFTEADLLKKSVVAESPSGSSKSVDSPGSIPYASGRSIRELIAQQLEISEAGWDPKGR